MSDSCQPQQRNLYQTKFAHLEYRDGKGTSYKEQLRQLSWPVPDDVPTHAQRSSMGAISAGKYDTLHPNAASIRDGELSFMQTHGGRGESSVMSESDPGQGVHARLFVPSKTVARPPSRYAASRPELDGDEAFTKGNLNAAIQCYTLALSQKPTLLCYEKRCAAWAHVGKYSEAMRDAEYVLARENSPSARLRVKNIQDFIDAKANCLPGYKAAHITLVCSLTPKELRQWRASGPSVYSI